MNRGKSVISQGRLSLITCMFLILSVLHSQNRGENIPFTLYSGEGLVFTEADLSGKPYICFYESRELEFLNNDLKNALREHRDELEEVIPDLQILPVVDCTDVRRIVEGLWNQGLRKKTIEQGYTVYGDWDGKIRSRYNLQAGESNILILDDDGNILYQNYGYIPESEIQVILSILLEES